jgi:glucose/mannose transport system substrate-binding protein
MRVYEVMRILGRLAATVALSLFVASSSSAADAPADGKLIIYHWWQSPSETSALKALVGAFSKKYPAVTVSTSYVPEHDVRNVGVFRLISNMVRARRAPDSFQMDPGYATQPFFDAGLLSPIDEIWAAEGLTKVVPPFIVELSRHGGHYYSIPVGVHRTNLIWYNKALLDKNQIKASTLTTWDALFKAADTLKAAGIPEPIQVGEGWTISQAFQCILAGQGLATYEDWANGKITAADDARIIDALKILERYLSYANKDRPALSWDKAVQRVIKKQGAFCLTGDWANGEFRGAGLKYGEDFDAIPVPGTKTLYGTNVDAFQHPRGILDEANSRRWLSLAASREGQDAFNPPKGSVSPRNDADASKYDAYQRSAMADMKSTRMFPAIGHAAPAAFGDRVDEILTAFADKPDVPGTARALAAATVALKGQFSRIWVLR